MTLSEPIGTTVRPARREDAEAVVAIIQANSLALIGEIDYSLEDLLEEWDDPDIDLERDTQVVFAPDGRLIAYAVVWSKGRPALPIIELYLHAAEWAQDGVTEPYLLGWAEVRARENLPELAPELRLGLRMYSDSRDERFAAVLAAAGFEPQRYSLQMIKALDEAPVAPVWPEGFSWRTAEPDDDPVPAFEAFRDAWRDHFGHVRRPYDEALKAWRHHWELSFAPGLWLLALDGDTVAGLCLCMPKFGPDEACGFVEILAVRRDYRRRGLAEALLRQSFVELYAAGKTSVRLFVDGQSLTGATRLYERTGMHEHSRYIMYEKELRPGIDVSTRAVGG
ncbi:MAG TPA: GNAT family N-acetyltransferase [Candidatus Limnocylindrales bacterium]|nr:GNAT family N-acetyltransferase [Candidatus Limnocylindrales bacterium]